jgi:ribosomal protein S18 acetylase RimI-like enzyme
MVRVYARDEPEAKALFGKISEYVQQDEANQMPWWVLVQDSNPVGLVSLGREPMNLLASPGTVVAIVQLTAMKQPERVLGDFVSEALRIAVQGNAGYAISWLPFDEQLAISQFKKNGFREFSDSYRMVCQLDRDYSTSAMVQFATVNPKEMRQFLQLGEEFMQDSPDVRINEALKHLDELSDEFLNSFYSMSRLYFANDSKQPVGILVLNEKRGEISIIAVNPQNRGKGIGRQIMLFGLRQLKDTGCKQAYLSVHAKNIPALHLYESLGFVKAERRNTLIWRRQS